MLKLLIAIFLVFGLAGSAFGQEMPFCDDKTVLAWNMNPEGDMDHYEVYNSPTATITVGGSGVENMQAPHDPDSAIDNGDGTKTVIFQMTLPATPERFFAVSAVDMAGNMTPLSNEIGCKIDVANVTPVIRFEFNFVPPA